MRRSSPRPFAAALEQFTEAARPATLLARTQGAWAEVCGTVIARESEPLAESGSKVTVSCSSAVWAQELELMEPDLRARLNAALGGGDEGPIDRLRFRHGGPSPARRRRSG